MSSALLERGVLGIDLKFPGVAAELNPDPADWQHPELQHTRERGRSKREPWPAPGSAIGRGVVWSTSPPARTRAPSSSNGGRALPILMAVNAAGRLPPQEKGLFSNSWNGKFHLEMHL